MAKKTNTANAIERELIKLQNKTIAAHAQGYFKTGKGEYGEGDKFLGLRAPVIHQQVKLRRELAHEEVLQLLHSSYHETRAIALLIFVDQYKRGNDSQKSKIYKSYLAHTQYINGWDLVDCSAHKIIGPHLLNRSRAVLYRLAKSPSLWERRIAIMSTFHFIRFSGLKDFSSTLKISEILLHDEQDLIHKAVGWMLREVGNQDRKACEDFLKKHYQQMPRTMLRYAIEKFPETLRKAYLKGNV